MPPQPTPQTYYYTIKTGNRSRKGELTASSVSQALQEIGGRITESDIQTTGRIDVSVTRTR